jgi:hypothetical protein
VADNQSEVGSRCRGKAKWEQADGRSGGKWHAFIKRQKRRFERHKAKRWPECPPGYGKYEGYET